MKKIFAIVLSLIMMLSVSACATGIEVGLSSVTLTEKGDVVMQMPDPGIRIAFAENEDGLGLRAALVADGQTALEAVITLGVDKLMARATGISDIYAVNLEQLMAIVEPYMEQLTAMIPADLQLSEADMAIVGQMATVVESAVANGVYTSEDAATMGVKIGAEDVRTLWGLGVELLGNHPEVLEMLEIPAEVLSELQMPADFNLSLDASLSYTDTGVAAALVLDAGQGGEAATIELTAATDLTSTATLGFAHKSGDLVFSAAEVVLSFAETDGAWMIPADAVTVDVLTMGEDQLNKLTSEAQGILSMFGLA